MERRKGRLRVGEGGRGGRSDVYVWGIRHRDASITPAANRNMHACVGQVEQPVAQRSRPCQLHIQRPLRLGARHQVRTRAGPEVATGGDMRGCSQRAKCARGGHATSKSACNQIRV
jgi:hypothetical protein